MLGINGGEFLLLLVVALVVVGPERLPRYAEQLGVWARAARRYALTARERVTEELGEDVADVDWAALDPRRYDPRRIVREALLEDDDPPSTSDGTRPAGAAARASGARAAAGAGARPAAGSSTRRPAAAGAGTARAGATAPAAAVPAAGGAAAAEPAAGDAPATGSGEAPEAASAPFDEEAT